MPHAAFYVVQLEIISCKERILISFNAARSILCGATSVVTPSSSLPLFQCRTQHFMWCNLERKIEDNYWVYVSMPHAAFYVVQLEKIVKGADFGSFNAARSILCGATTEEVQDELMQIVRFNAARSILCGATSKRLPRLSLSWFQCRTQHFMWCNVQRKEELL